MIEPNAWCILYYLQICLTRGMTWKGDRGILNMRYSILKKATEQAGLSGLKIFRYGAFPPTIANKRIGPFLEQKIEKVRIFKPFLPFLYIEAEKPVAN